MQFSALQSLSVFFVERTLKKPEAILFAVVFVKPAEIRNAVGFVTPRNLNILLRL